MVSFTSWQIKTSGISKLFGDLDSNEAVWQGDDGSIVVGNAGEFGPEHEDAEYTESGTVGEWLED